MFKWIKSLFTDPNTAALEKLQLEYLKQIQNDIKKNADAHYLNNILGDMHIVDRFETEWLNDKNEGHDN